ncbi:hypothetical protein BDW59DRAFT_159952 [Aspergillus cavernicola]|uniref:Uncharacterized protein n=1 Tax=Aspergillus cavernicola TaxID=176166 RepID=A0ABR4IJN6_9EURO
MENKDWPAREFITSTKLQDLWTEDELRRAANFMELYLDIDGIKVVKNDLLRTFSILVTILWDKWEKFPDLFLRGKHSELGNKDEDVMKLSREQLEHSLGAAYASLFRNRIAAFNPIIIASGHVIKSDEKAINPGNNAERKEYVEDPNGI